MHRYDIALRDAAAEVDTIILPRNKNRDNCAKMP